MSVSTDDFLKYIYLLNQEGEVSVPSSLLANRLNISAAAVTDMARKLGQEGLLDYRPYRSLVLSDKGRRIALSIVRKHRLWELFLFEVLHLDLLKVHEEAEKLEHNTSEFLIEQIYHFLGKPDFDPHGDPIPGEKGEVPSEAGSIMLADAVAGKTYIIRKLKYHDHNSAEMYKHYKLKPGTNFVLKKKFSFDGSMELESEENNTFVISRQLATYIFCVEKTEVQRI